MSFVRLLQGQQKAKDQLTICHGDIKLTKLDTEGQTSWWIIVGMGITLFSLTKNLVYKNIEAQLWKEIRIIIRTLSASRPEEFKNILTSFVAIKNIPFHKEQP